MLPTVRTLLVLFALPPVVLISYVHLMPIGLPEWLTWLVLFALAAASIAAVAVSGWSMPSKVIFGGAYLICAMWLLPLGLLLAACIVSGAAMCI